MSRITTTFDRLRSNQRKALVPFITAGFPSIEIILPLMHTLVKAGADIIELGVPFSDPMADGPTIQRSSEKALKNGMTLRNLLQIVEAFRADDQTTPIVLMGYANPIEAIGLTRFAETAAKAGVDGVLVVDYPPEESEPFAQAMEQHGLDPIFLLAPTSSPERFKQVGRLARGYVYYVSLKGVTGSAQLDITEVSRRIPEIRAAVSVPVGVGFGIRDAATAAQMATVADAVIVGSKIIETLENAPAGEELAQVATFISELRQGLDQGSKP